MFTDEECQSFCKELSLLGIAGEKEQREVLEYFYTLGKIIYHTNVGRYEEEN